MNQHEGEQEFTEIHCHDCNTYITVAMEKGLDGNHVVKCPCCGHEHCRVIKSGKVTDVRWDQRNGQTYRMTVIGTSTTSMNVVWDQINVTFNSYTMVGQTTQYLFSSWASSSAYQTGGS